MYQQIVRTLLNDMARSTLCAFGWHTRSTGIGFDVCTRGCGYVRQPGAAKPYVVTLRDGSIYNVMAINRHHAESLVVYGDGPLRINMDGTPLGRVTVHRANIQSVEVSVDVPRIQTRHAE